MATVYVVINEELDLNPVEIATQSCKAVASMTKLLEGMKPAYLKFYTDWQTDGLQVQFVKTDWETFDSLWDTFGKNIPEFKKSPWCIGEVDPTNETNGEDGTMTVLAFRPMKKGGIPKEIIALKELVL
jgi:Peptidyl-tRNA hydrolase PTH2